MKSKLLIFIFVGLMLSTFALADQIVWDNDSNITFQDNWKDVDGRPLFGASCNWYVYNPSGTLNQSGTHTQIIPGIFEITIDKLDEIGIYPFMFNCTKSGNMGISSRDSIRIVDEITEDFKDIIDQINITTIEINQTTHMTYDLLAGEINDTINEILNMNFTIGNISQISSELELILSNTDLIVDKWGNEDAKEIVYKLKDLDDQIRELDFRFKFISSGELEQRVLSIFSTSKDIDNKLNDTDDGINFSLWFWIILGVIIFILIISIASSKKK